MIMAKKITKQTVLTLAGVAIAFAGVFGGAVVISKINEKQPANAAEVTSVTTYTPQKKEAPAMTSESTELQFKKDMDLILVMGTDNRKTLGEEESYINYSQADCIYLYAIDHKNKTYQVLQISRETMCDVQTYTTGGQPFGVDKMQICLAHSYGKNERERCLNTVDAASGLLFNIPIAHYVSFGMDSIGVLNDKVGGVTVTVPAGEGLSEVDPAFVDGATITLDGKQAELFVRTRYVLKNDHNEPRMARQEIFMKAFKEQAKAKMETDQNFAPSLLLALSDNMYSDMSANDLSNLAAKLREYKDLGTLTTIGEIVEEGPGHLFREFYVNKDDLQKKVIELCYEPKSES